MEGRQNIGGCIAHLQTNLEWGGGENQVLQLLSGLRGSGVDAALWARADGILYQRACAMAIPVYPLPSVGWMRRLLPGALSPLCDALRARGVSLLHVHDSEGLDLGIRIRRKTGLPLVYNRRIASPIRSGWFSQRKYTPGNIEAVLAISETVRRVMSASSRYPSSRIFIAPTGVDAAALDAVLPDVEWRRAMAGEGRLAGGLGRLAPKKNWAFLVRTAAACRAVLPDLRWVVAGEGPERDPLERLARDLGVADIVRFVGFHSEGTRLLKSLDLLFFPSLREGASVTIREAMLLGVPVAAMNAEGSLESLDGHGWVLEPGDVEGAVRTVREILENAVRREDVVRAARQSALDRFTFERTVADTMAVYGRVAGLAGAHGNAHAQK